MGLLAEQIVIECPPSRLEELFSHRPATWMKPLLRLAGDEGEALGLALLIQEAAGGRSPRRYAHVVDVGEASHVNGNLRMTLQWRTSDYRLLFAALEGVLEVRPLDDHSVVSIEGVFTGGATAAARRAAESAVRCLLLHLRTAVEESSVTVL